jgi:hypothetical protein
MGLLIAVLATVLVLFMVAAMAVAEWSDLDPGQVWNRLWKRPDAAPAPAPPAPAAGDKAPRPRAAVSRNTRGRTASAKKQVARKPTTTKRKPR